MMTAAVSRVSMEPGEVQVVSAVECAKQTADDGEQQSKGEATKEKRAHRERL